MKQLSIVILTALLLLYGCKKEDVQNPGGNETIVKIQAASASVERMRSVTLEAHVQNIMSDGLEYKWLIGDFSIGSSKSVDFVSLSTGAFLVKVQLIKNAVVLASDSISITVTQETSSYSPYVSRVFEYTPAPGQFVNQIPAYAAGDDAAVMAKKAEDAIAKNKQGIITLGSYGGYVVVGFDHSIVNVPDSADFKILGNAFWAASNPNSNASARGGSCEPGIVMVSVDANKNGKPDDEWYELAGSEYSKASTIKKYEITYYKPDENKTPTPDNSYPYLNDTTYVRWTTNGYDAGYVSKNVFHNQSYWPQWISDSQLKFAGTKLADNYKDESGNGSYFVQYAYGWGYADNAPNTDAASNFRIEWAIDKNGHPVQLPAIDFVKIYTGVNQYAGWLGETSTEIMGVNDLHLVK